MYDVQKHKIPDLEGRVETGPVKFNDDWTGLFIRGDNAAYYALCLSSVLKTMEKIQIATSELSGNFGSSHTPFEVSALQDLMNLLISTREH